MNDLNTYQVQTNTGDISFYIDNNLPWVSSPDSEFDLCFYQTRDTLLDVEIYRSFIKNAISRFRSSRYYKSYKSYLMSIGLDKCFILGNIDESMADIEMHHNFLTIYDIALMITEHTINTRGYINSFELIQTIIDEHQANRIPIVMLSKTVHELYHSDQMNFIPQTFGKWWELLYNYRFGITIDIAKKVIKYIESCCNSPNGNMLMNMRQDIMGFAQYNEYGYPESKCVVLNYDTTGYNHIESIKEGAH